MMASQISALRTFTDELNATIRTAAEEHGFEFIDPSPQFVGHGLCNNPFERWVNSVELTSVFSPGIISDLTGGLIYLHDYPWANLEYAVHPTAEGQEAIAAAIKAHLIVETVVSS